MSLTSYRAAPPRDKDNYDIDLITDGASKTWQLPTLPRLKPQYHRRSESSHSSSGWDRVFPSGYCHQVIETPSNGDVMMMITNSSVVFAEYGLA